MAGLPELDDQAVTWETAVSADGPALAQWFDGALRRRQLLAGDVGADFPRRLYAWRHGENTSFFTVDRYVCRIGVHPMDLPEHIWRSCCAKVRQPAAIAA